MRLHGLKQPPYNTTMMGVVKGALDYYGISRTPGEAFVLSGHAFVMNVHEELCPSGPYSVALRPVLRAADQPGLGDAERGHTDGDG